MSKKTENLYSKYQKQIKNKDTALYSFIENALAKTQSMFVYKDLPETIPSYELEKLLQTNGTCFFTKVNGKFYVFKGTLGGTVDVYEQPTKYTVANVALNLTKTFDIDTDGVLMRNDVNGNSLLPVIGKFGVLYVDGLISLNTLSVLSRITMLISATDDKTRESAESFVKKILDGDFSVIGENAFFKGVNLQTPTAKSGTDIAQLIEYVQYIKASFYNEMGLNANFNMKRERLNMGEVELNTDALFPYVDNMLTNRQQAIEKINEKYDLNISVELGSSWNYNHESLENTVEQVDTENAPQNPKDDTDEQETNSDKPETDNDEQETETDKPETDTDKPENDSDNDETEKNK